MKTYLFSLFATFLAATSIAVAQETVTITATDDDISNNLDLKAVASVFGESKDLESFEQKLNNYDMRISNLDLNGDGEVDYLRVIETAEGNKHLVVIQAILAQDIYQDVASIYVEKDETTKKTSVQVVGNEYIYGENYVIEPVYIQVPVIYDYFWRPAYTYWYSPYYWGYYPSYWHVYHCWAIHDYWHHIHAYHHHHPYCSYRYSHVRRSGYDNMHSGLSRNDYGTRHPERSFSSRNKAAGLRNTRDIQTARMTRTSPAMQSNTTASRTFNSRNVRTAQQATRVSGNSGSRTASSTTTSRTVRSTVAQTPSSRSAANSTTARSASSSSRSSAYSSRSNSSSRSSSPSVSRSTSSVSRSSSSPSSSRSSSSVSRSSSAGRSSSYSPSRSSSSVRSSGGSYSGGSSRSSGGGSRSGSSSGSRR